MERKLGDRRWVPQLRHSQTQATLKRGSWKHKHLGYTLHLSSDPCRDSSLVKQDQKQRSRETVDVVHTGREAS